MVQKDEVSKFFCAKSAVEDLRHQKLGDTFLQHVPSLMLAAQAVCHPHLHLHLHLHACLVHELDMLVFALTWQRLHVFLGDQVARATWPLADMQDSSNTMCRIQDSAGEEYRPKAGHVILSPFESSSLVVPKFYI